MCSDKDHLTVGFPQSEIHGSKPARGSPWLIATCYVLHRLSMPRHPPNALNALDTSPSISQAETKGLGTLSTSVGNLYDHRLSE